MNVAQRTIKITGRLGFSLPEVAIATAIAALGMITLLGLIPNGLDNIRQAGNSIATSRICQQMISEVQSADWGDKFGGPGGFVKLGRYHLARRYFDGDGTLLGGTGLPQTGQSSAGLTAYVAMYEFIVNNGPILSGAEKAGGYSTNTDLQRVIIHVKSTSNQDYDFANAKSKSEARAFTLARQF